MRVPDLPAPAPVSSSPHRGCHTDRLPPAFGSANPRVSPAQAHPGAEARSGITRCPRCRVGTLQATCTATGRVTPSLGGRCSDACFTVRNSEARAGTEGSEPLLPGPFPLTSQRARRPGNPPFPLATSQSTCLRLWSQHLAGPCRPTTCAWPTTRPHAHQPLLRRGGNMEEEPGVSDAPSPGSSPDCLPGSSLPQSSSHYSITSSSVRATFQGLP